MSKGSVSTHSQTPNSVSDAHPGSHHWFRGYTELSSFHDFMNALTWPLGECAKAEQRAQAEAGKGHRTLFKHNNNPGK